MIFSETRLKGVYVIEPEKLEDHRGFFARTWDQEIFAQHNLDPKIVQCSISFNKKKGTLRGMHYQAAPYEETKVVRVTRGSIFEVVIDLRQKSETFKHWISIEMSAENYKILYVPKGMALGFQTLDDNTEVFYQISEFYMPEYTRGIHWNDPAFQITWPLKPTVISERDNSFPFF